MNVMLGTGTTFFILALASYSVAVLTEQRKKILRKRVLIFITLGVVLDITATILMILGASENELTAHSILGYSALTVMFINAALIWWLKIKKGTYSVVPDFIHIYTRYAFAWWIVALLAGVVLVAYR